MKTYYKEYRDGDRRKPTGVICVFSEESLPVEQGELPQEALWMRYKCLTSEVNANEPMINYCSLAYLLSRAETCTEEDAASIEPEIVDLIKKSEQYVSKSSLS